MIGFIFLSMIVLLIALSWGIVKLSKPASSNTNAVIDSSILFIFFIGHISIILSNYLSPYAEYYVQIDRVDSAYTPISFEHAPSFVFFYVLNLIASFFVWTKGKKLPPLTFALAVCAMIYWTIICIPWTIQFFYNSDPKENYNPGTAWFFMLAPISFILFNGSIFLSLIKDRDTNWVRNQYKNKFLNYLNNKLIDSQKRSIWILIIFLPFLVTILCILMIFGQYPDSMIKVFTDTTTWTLSQKSHPPFLDHQGHYLCTVAACGSPQIVKPQRIGLRNGNPIIVNRQLSIANAFENLIEIKFPKTHRIIRRNYDKYGYPLSKRITSRFGANLTYLLMKPLEWFFLVFIYLFSLKPEELIHKQYRNPS